jgi:hypothetical protein
VARQLELVQHVDLQRPEAAAEGDLLCRRDALVAEHQHVMIEMRLMDALEITMRQRRPRSTPMTSAPSAAPSGRISKS